MASQRLLLADQSKVDHGVSLSWLTGLAQRALPKVMELALPESPLIGLAEVEFTFVNDATIARVHEDFMDVSGPTDVITFHHGEVLISVETATVQADDFERSVAEELGLYVIHGLLHLGGYDDKTPDEFDVMASLQDRILQECKDSSQ